IGAAITLETELGRQTRTLQAGSGFLSQHSKEVFFGLGTVKGPVTASIRWPSGLVQRLAGIPPNHRILVEEGLDDYRAEPFRPRTRTSPISAIAPLEGERLPVTVETWFLVIGSAP